MSDIEYSSDALNTINKFYRVDVVVYVEGDDDIVFWQCIFEAFSNVRVDIHPLSGSSQLDNYIEKIKEGTLNAIAARDSDYLEFVNKKHSHPRILYTYGYSIENSLHTVYSIQQMCKVSLRGGKVSLSDCNDWLRHFSLGFKELLKLDIANEIEGAGIEVLGDNCTRFMENESSDLVSYEKTIVHKDKISERLRLESKNKVNALNIETDQNILRWLRGHLLVSGMHKFISNRLKDSGRKSNISYEQIYTNSIHQFCASLNNGHPHNLYYEQSVMSAVGSFS